MLAQTGKLDTAGTILYNIKRISGAQCAIDAEGKETAG